MNVLYVHGLDSSPNPERMGFLEARGHQVLALHLDYRNQPDSYQILRNAALEGSIEAVVGSSLGGYLSFWLSLDLGLPCLLFNPAVYLARDRGNIPVPQANHCPARYVVLGEEDDTVNPFLSWGLIRDTLPPAEKQRVLMVQALGHQIPLPIFEESVRWADF